jgi:hypothetical protein
MSLLKFLKIAKTGKEDDNIIDLRLKSYYFHLNIIWHLLSHWASQIKREKLTKNKN